MTKNRTQRRWWLTQLAFVAVVLLGVGYVRSAPAAVLSPMPPDPLDPNPCTAPPVAQQHVMIFGVNILPAAVPAAPGDPLGVTPIFDYTDLHSILFGPPPFGMDRSYSDYLSDYTNAQFAVYVDPDPSVMTSEGLGWYYLKNRGVVPNPHHLPNPSGVMSYYCQDADADGRGTNCYVDRIIGDALYAIFQLQGVGRTNTGVLQALGLSLTTTMAIFVVDGMQDQGVFVPVDTMAVGDSVIMSPGVEHGLKRFVQWVLSDPGLVGSNGYSLLSLASGNSSGCNSWAIINARTFLDASLGNPTAFINQVVAQTFPDLRPTATATETPLPAPSATLTIALGTACAVNEDCGPGFCVDGVCCNTACGGGVTNECQACSIAAGGTVDGTCTPSTGNTCDSGDGCPADTCQAGVCQPIACQHVDAVVLVPGPVNIVIPPAKTEVDKTLAVTVRNADTTDRTILLQVDATDCPAGSVGAVDFGGGQNSILVKAVKTKKASVPLTIHNADFTSFNFKAPTRCTLVFTASAVVTGGSNDPNPSNNQAVVELNVVDKHDTEQTARHETTIKSRAPATVTIAYGAATGTKKLTAVVGNADYRPAAETPGDPITLQKSASCSGVTLSTPVCDPIAGSATATIKGGATKTCKLTATVDPYQIYTTNKLSPMRCMVTLTAVGPTTPETAPLDPSNTSTELTIDITDKNDF
jgi:hypothetical protein